MMPHPARDGVIFGDAIFGVRQRDVLGWATKAGERRLESEGERKWRGLAGTEGERDERPGVLPGCAKLGQLLHEAWCGEGNRQQRERGIAEKGSCQGGGVF